jgi:hypothetical protein
MKPSTESVERPMPEPFEPISYRRRTESTQRMSHDQRLLKLGIEAYQEKGSHLVHASTRLFDSVVDDLDLIQALCRY